MSLVLALLLLRKSFTVKRRITQPRVGCTYDETYCYLSLYIIISVQVSLLLVIGQLLMLLFQVLIGDKYQDLFLSDSFSDCAHPSSFRNLGVLRFLFNLVMCSVTTSRVATTMLQNFEWYAMLFLIKQQKGRDINQIYFDHNNENISSPIRFRSTQTNYRRKEMFVQTCFRA